MAVDFIGRDKPKKSSLQALKNMKLRPNLFLGLGGIGSESVSKIKDLFLQTFHDYLVPGKTSSIPEGIQFLCFDSDQFSMPANLGKGREWVWLTANKLTAKDCKNYLQHPFYAGWLPTVIEHDFQNGAGGYRALGRFLSIHNIDRVAKKLREKINTATSYGKLDIARPLICIFAGLAGGTGSGLLLDTCFFLRKNYPDADIYGFLGMVPGLESADPISRRNATIGSFCALKEIDSFMARTRLEGDFADGVEYAYPAGKTIHCVIDKPFDKCFLISNANARGITNLSTRDKMSSFMARCAFLLTAYSTQSEKGVRSFESEMNDRQGQLEGTDKGTALLYCVPAIAQVNLPKELVIEYLACRSANKCLSYLRGGDPYDDSLSYDFFRSRLNLGLGDLKAYFESESGITLSDWAKMVEAALKDKSRYNPKKRETILSWADEVLNTHPNEYKDAMKPSFKAKVATVQEHILEEMKRITKNSNHRLTGVIDFLDDLSKFCNQEIKEFANLKEIDLNPAREQLNDNWNAVRPLVLDVCTKSGVFDVDRFKIRKVTEAYSIVLEGADREVLRLAQYESAAEALREISMIITDFREAVQGLKVAVDNSIMVLREGIKAQEAELYQLTSGGGSDPLSICSYSPIDSDWCDRFLAKDETYGAEALLETICSGGWTPLDWLQNKTDTKWPRIIAQDIYDRLKPKFGMEIANKALHDLLSSSITGADSARQVLSRVMNEYISPQVRFEKMKHLHLPWPSMVRFMAGQEESVTAILESSDNVGEGEYAQAVSYEPDRISILEIHHPVSLAGLDVLHDFYYPTYKRWLEELRKMDKKEREVALRKFHCFPGSSDWREPIEFRSEIMEDERFFAQCLAVSCILDPEANELLGESERMQLEHWIAKVKDKSRSNPKHVRPAIFRIGARHFWLVPFIEESSKHDAKGAMFPLPERPVKIGETIVKATNNLKNNGELRGYAEKWTIWFKDKWIAFFNENELKGSFNLAFSVVDRMLRAWPPDSDDHKLWKNANSILMAWRDELIG